MHPTLFRTVSAVVGLAMSALVLATSVVPSSATISRGTVIDPGAPPKALRLTVVSCPPSIIAAATNAPEPWNWGGVTMNVVGTKLSDRPLPDQQMMCFYEGAGSKWNIGRAIQPEFKSCAVASTSSFTCQK